LINPAVKDSTKISAHTPTRTEPITVRLLILLRQMFRHAILKIILLFFLDYHVLQQ